MVASAQGLRLREFLRSRGGYREGHGVPGALGEQSPLSPLPSVAWAAGAGP